MEKRIATGKAADGRVLTEAEKAESSERLAEIGGLFEQARIYVHRPPTLTFRDGVTVDLGGREVEIRHGGRGNTAGDAFVYLPREKILVAGDLLVRPVPYAFDGYPAEWIRTLEGLAALDADAIVPGHGDVMRDKSYLTQVIALMKSAVPGRSRAQARFASEPRGRGEGRRPEGLSRVDGRRGCHRRRILRHLDGFEVRRTRLSRAEATLRT